MPSQYQEDHNMQRSGRGLSFKGFQERYAGDSADKPSYSEHKHAAN